jgi:hypothetical protein
MFKPFRESRKYSMEVRFEERGITGVKPLTFPNTTVFPLHSWG